MASDPEHRHIKKRHLMTQQWKTFMVLAWLSGISFGGLTACDSSSALLSDTESSYNSDEETDTTDQYSALSEPLFAIDKVMDVQIEMNKADWDLLRYESPNMEHFAEDDCPSGPRPTPFNWYKASVTVNGDSFGEIEVRKKGFLGSMDPLRPSLKLNFKKDHMPGAVERMTLNNMAWDSSFSRECMSYHLFRKAGIAAPRCGLAKVTVNGTDFGIYTHIEEIKPPMLSLHYGQDAAAGDLYEIATADFMDGLESVFEPKGDNAAAYDTSAIHRVTEALKADDDTLFEELKKSVDLDEFFSFWAMEVVTAHWDGYSGQRNNSFLYRNPKTDLFEFIPWGTDGAFSIPEDFFGRYTGAYDTMPWSLYAHGALARRLINHREGKAKYKETLLHLLDTVWDEAELVDMLDTIQSTALPYLDGNTVDANAYETEFLRAMIASHKKDILDEIDADPNWPTWDRPVNPPHCASITDTLSGTLTTAFESLDVNLIDTGSGEASDNDGSKIVTLPIVRGLVGTWVDNYNGENTVVEIAVGPVSGSTFFVIYTYFPSELFFEGNTVKLNYGEAQTDVLTTDIISGETIDYGFAATGRLTIDALEDAPGGNVQISFEVPVGAFRM
jgi:spore coat protein CotH